MWRLCVTGGMAVVAGVLGLGATVGAQSAPAAQAPPSAAAIEAAERVLAMTRQALGGAALSGVRTLVAEGRTRRVRGNKIQSIEFEIAIELPDKYVREDEFPAEEADPVRMGFVGADLIGAPVPAARGADVPGASQGARALSIRQDFARLALGIFADSFDAYPLTFSYLAQAKAPQGSADVLDGRGEGDLVLRFFLDSATHMPIMTSWQLPPTSVVLVAAGQPAPSTVAPGAVIVAAPAPPAASAPKAEQDEYAKTLLALRARAQVTPVEHRLYYADYRDVSGVRLPFRLRRAIGSETTEETTFDRFRINTRIDSRTFTPIGQ